MLKSVKDFKRRLVETVMSGSGVSEKTVDPEFEAHKEYFNYMVEDMNEIGACLSETLTMQKTSFSELRQLASVMARVYVRNEEISDWPDCENKMQELPGAIAFSEVSDYVHNSIRSSAGMCVVETTLEPLRAAVTKMCPEIADIIKVRDEALKDFDAHRRRVKNLTMKIEAVPGKADILEPELNKFEAKLYSSEYKYGQADVKAKHEILLARLAHDKLIDMLLITFVVCQEELYSRAAAQLRDVIAQFPQDKVARVRDRMSRLVNQGGVFKLSEQATVPKGKLERVTDVLTGKLAPMEAVGMKAKFKKKQEDEQEMAARIQGHVTKAKARDEYRRSEVGSGGGGGGGGDMGRASESGSSRPRSERRERPKSQSNRNSSRMHANSPPQPPPGPGKRKVVVALWDLEGQAEDELSFKRGDVIYVLDEMKDGSWWLGRHLDGRQGVFPTNYVRVQE